MTVQRRSRLFMVFLTLVALLFMLAAPVRASAPPQDKTGVDQGGSDSLTQAGRRVLELIAEDTWRFYGVDVDSNTGLPRDNIGLYGAPAEGNYTSPTNIGVYLWSIVAANDLGLINRHRAQALIAQTITTVEHLRKWNGFLLSWYDTRNGHCITGPGGTDCESGPLTGQFISNVDNGWYGAGLVVTRQYLMNDDDHTSIDSHERDNLARRVSALLNAMDYGVFYDRGNQCAEITAGQMYGGYIVDQGPATFHYGLLNTETRITAYMGIGTHTMPGDVWWRTWRTLPTTNPPHPPSGCAIDTANFDWQGQYPPHGYYTTYNDPQSGQPFTVLEGHYVYTGTTSFGNIGFVPSWGGSEFEGLMPNLVVPETSWGPRSFGLNDVNYAKMEVAWATQGLHYPVWGLSPSSTPDDTGGYDAFGAAGPPYPNALASNANCCPYQQYAVTPHASFLALQVLPQQALANIQALRQRYPGVYGPYGFFDAVNPTTGSVGHRYLVLDQSMIMAALDNVLEGRAMQRHFAADPVAQADRPYLQIEQFSINP
jgi:hypothetical protein